MAEAAGERAAHPDRGDAERFYIFSLFDAYLFVSLKQRFAGLRVFNVGYADAPREAFGHRDGRLAVLLEQRTDLDSAVRAAVLIHHDEILRDVDEAARQITGLGGTEGRVGESLSRSVR
ncbi:hypothetical protein SDC9_82146 [bioreactor metagenome]|uniref:Uncharacterized protein n=1 Tax=bioreactor metagenome TaxID=1076179 RepID=A0A644ZA17_9ZZZZ